MNDDIRLAFSHPADRSTATASVSVADRISLRDHIVDVEIGAFQAERGTTQRISFNVVVEVASPDSDTQDDVDRILSYDTVTEAIAYELGAERLNLLETLAERVADRILLEPQAMRVFVRIEKLDRGSGALGVEIVRGAADVATPAAQGTALRSQVIYLSNPALHSAHMSAWLDRIEAVGTPVILCVGRHDLPLPQSGQPAPQRRIDLLAIEQSAWCLAARDPRCVVVATRTELDWAMKNGQISVWAPSKIVLDAVDGPQDTWQSGVELARWLADSLGSGMVEEIDDIAADR